MPANLMPSTGSLLLALFLCVFAAASRAYAQPPAAQLVAEAMEHERAQDAHPQYTSYLSQERSSRTGGHLWTEKVVETPDGELRRLIAQDGQPVSAEKARREDDRLAHIAAHPGSSRHAGQSRGGQEESDLTRAVPRMFRFSYENSTGECTSIHFEPDPAFKPSTYEERVVHALKGTLLISQPDHHLCGVDAQISQTVSFGFGLLGQVKQGGTVRLAFLQTPWGQWVAREMHVHVSGSELLVKSLSRDRDDTRTDFVQLPARLTAQQAVDATRP